MKAISQIVHRKIQPLATPRNSKPQKLDTLELFQRNLEAIREWYREKPGHGHDLGHFVLLELCLADVISALSAATQGKPWAPPSA